MLNILLIVLILAASECLAKYTVICIERHIDGTKHRYELSKHNTCAQLRAVILKHKSDILNYTQLLRYRPEDYYVAIYTKEGSKILTVSNESVSIGPYLGSLRKPGIIINVAPYPYCEPIEIKRIL